MTFPSYIKENFRPMLAGKSSDEIIQKHLAKIALFLSPKLDGIRGTVIDGVLVSRSRKPIRNRHLQGIYGQDKYNCLDGELISGPPTAPDVFRRTTTAVMTENGQSDAVFHVFDSCTTGIHYPERLALVRGKEDTSIVIVPQHIVTSLQEIKLYEESYTDKGYEGVILRRPDTYYKFGRSTSNEGALLKVKRFLDAEATVLGMEELLHNDNAATTNELGLTQRSSHKDNKIGLDTLGAFIVQDTVTGIEFNIGTGLTQEQRQFYWNNYSSYVGKIVSYKYFPVGVKEKPRHPVFLGFRDEDDLD